MKAKGWGSELVRLQAEVLPVPVFSIPDEIPGPPTILPDLESISVVDALSEPEAAAECP